MKQIKNPIESEWAALTNRPSEHNEERKSLVRDILDNVKARGDQAIKNYTLQFDKIDLQDLRVTDDEFSAAYSIPQNLKDAIHASIRNVRFYHDAQTPKRYSLSTEIGLECRRIFSAIEKVGLYIPGGNTPLISTLIMLGIPALIAGCETIVICTPPRQDGTVDPGILYVAQTLGLKIIYKIGGAQAIGAMAYGTETIPAVSKIFGPGNSFVATAKSLVSAEGTAIDLPAGPSEVLVIADETANADFIAADLLSQAEHGPDSQVGLITWDAGLCDKVKQSLEIMLAELPRREIAQKSLEDSFLVTVENAEKALELANDYASEHLIIATAAPERYVPRVKNAGSIFLGHYSSESFGDYISGPNHVLPTNRAAKAYSGLGVDAFGRYISIQSANENAVRILGDHVVTLAEAEGLQAHANAVRVRMNALGNDPINDRTSSIVRQTKETICSVSLNLDGKGHNHISTGLGFFNHMLQQIAVHGLIDLFVAVIGDTHIDEHHTIEDTGLALGQAFLKAIGNKQGMRRYGFIVPMDETRSEAIIDFSGRPAFIWNVGFQRDRVGDMPTEMMPHFFRSFADAAQCALHISSTGENDHHVIEGVFKAFAKALRMAVEKDERMTGIPSSKGSL